MIKGSFSSKPLFALIFALATLALVSNVWADSTLLEPKKGKTCVTVDKGFKDFLRAIDVAPGLIKPAVSKKGKNCFPIRGGGIHPETLRGEIFHGGGWSLTQNATVVEFTSFIIDTTDRLEPVLSVLVVVDGALVDRRPLFNLELDDTDATQKDKKLKIKNVELTLTQKAADGLNHVFETTSFYAGQFVGTADVTVKFYYHDKDDGDCDDECSSCYYTLPELITENDVTICLAAGYYDGDLEVRGNNVTVIGKAGKSFDHGSDCEANGWTTFEGNVGIYGNNSTFKNIKFTGDVDERGNNTTYINSCFF